MGHRVRNTVRGVHISRTRFVCDTLFLGRCLEARTWPVPLSAPTPSTFPVRDISDIYYMLLRHNIKGMGRRLINISERDFFISSPLLPYTSLDTCLISQRAFFLSSYHASLVGRLLSFIASLGGLHLLCIITEDTDTDSLAASSSRALGFFSSSCFCLMSS